jgi:hypothetical protein
MARLRKTLFSHLGQVAQIWSPFDFVKVSSDSFFKPKKFFFSLQTYFLKPFKEKTPNYKYCKEEGNYHNPIVDS